MLHFLKMFLELWHLRLIQVEHVISQLSHQIQVHVIILSALLRILSDLTLASATGTVTDAAGNPMTNFVPTVNLAANKALIISTPVPPTLTEVTPVTTPTFDTTPTYVFHSTEAGDITYSGGCTSSTTVAVVGNNTITFDSLAVGTHDCTITVTDIDTGI
jgi:hypothetical protein